MKIAVLFRSEKRRLFGTQPCSCTIGEFGGGVRLTDQIKIGNITIDIVRKKIKHMNLTIYPPTGRIRLGAPARATDDALRLFAISKLEWIKRHLDKLENQQRVPPRRYKNGECHYFQGKRYLLTVMEEDSRPKVILKNESCIELHLRPKTPVEQRHKILSEWYRTEVKKQIPAMIEKWENVLNIKVNEWQVKQMKTKWGSCNIGKRRIWINLELAKKRACYLEYVIVHEMVHFFERHHTARFRRYMDEYLPNWRQLQTELTKLPIGYGG